MKRFLAPILLFAIIFLSPICCAQSLDDFLGLKSAPCPTTNQQQSATLTQNSGSTTVTAAVSNGAAYFVGAYIRVSNANATLNTVFNGASVSAGADQITNIVGNTLTMTSPVTAGSTQTNVSGTVALDYFYTASGIVTPSWGTRTGFCTPEGNWYFGKFMSDAAAGPSAGEKLHFSYTSPSSTATGGVVTMNITGNAWITPGMRIVVSSCSDANYNGTEQVTTASSSAITYADASAGASATGCSVVPYNWDQYKYNSGSSSGVACAGAMGQLQRDEAVGFNGIGDDSDSWYFSYNTAPVCTPPSGYSYPPGFTPVTTPAVTRYAQANLWSCWAQPLKDPFYALDRTLTGLQESVFDWFDPNWAGGIACAFGTTTHNPAGYFNSPFLLGMTVDDSDNMGHTRSGPWWHPTSGGSVVTAILPSLIVMYAPPQITLSDKSIYHTTQTPLPNLYPNATLFSKALSASQPSGCWADTSATTPGGNPVGPSYAKCSLTDWLRNQYQTIAALNTSWGTSYTTFGSSQSTFTGESHALTDTSLSHTNVTPRSVALYLTPSGGSPVMVSGDCQAQVTDCPAGTIGHGQFLNAASCITGATTFYQSTGIVCTDPNGNMEEVTTAGQNGSAPTWPAAGSTPGTVTSSGGVRYTLIGPAITGAITYATGVISLTASYPLPSGETLTTSYTTGGWDAGGTGLLDEDGSNAHLTTNGACPASPPAWQPNHNYTAYADNSVVEFQVSGANYYAIALQSFTSGSSAPTWASTNGAPVNDGTVTAAWGVLGVPVSDASNGLEFKVACGTNTQFAADMTAWVETYIGNYLQIVQTAFKAINPAMLNFGVNFGANDYGDPTWEGVMKAEQLYTDAGFWGEYMNGSQNTGLTADPQAVWKQNYEFTYFKKPAMIEEFEASASNWETLGGGATCNPSPTQWSNTSLNCWTNPVTRNQGFYSQLLDELQFKAPDGNYYYSGITWWSDHCGNAATANSTGCLGLWDNDDNRIDGNEDVTSSVACSTPLGTLSCGGELSTIPWLSLNAETATNSLVAALALPYSGSVAPSVVAPTKKWIARALFPSARLRATPLAGRANASSLRKIPSAQNSPR